ILKMVEEDRYCLEVSSQIMARSFASNRQLGGSKLHRSSSCFSDDGTNYKA
ncbi:MAG: metal-sensing transcriptional repressor, partial [Clostridiales bacterium]|nr:metal-sensing transcriptional repressor [Clostridiales bacterium]